MKRRKKAPTRQGQGQGFNTKVSYTNAPRLSTAAQILLLIAQTPDHADRLRRACYARLDTVLRLHYTEGRAGQ
jgi:hypothetical protein